jgi:phage tail sheath protein FI
MRSQTISAASSSAVRSPETKLPAMALSARLQLWADRLAPAGAFVALIIVW